MKKTSFSLIELLIVVLILAALAVIVVPRISQGSANAKAEACRKNINMLNSAIECFYIENESCPPDLLTISKDPNLFPDGQPTCPVTGGTYPKWLNADDRVDNTKHFH
ncbi:MAG: hypothetical protein KAS75_05695 [Planctomycetes bacterium]|nr:hypothetical protein [Planctomycetota bacterium]